MRHPGEPQARWMSWCATGRTHFPFDGCAQGGQGAPVSSGRRCADGQAGLWREEVHWGAHRSADGLHPKGCSILPPLYDYCTALYVDDCTWSLH